MAIQIRRGTDANWEANNSNIVEGEPAITTDSGRFFVGTGEGTFAEFLNVDDVTNLAKLTYTSVDDQTIQLSDGTNDIFPTLANTTIESGTDLNDLMDEGLYNCPNSTVAGSLTHSPISNAGFPLLVFRMGTSLGRMQVIFSGTSIYSRRRTTSAWGNWYAFTGTT